MEGQYFEKSLKAGAPCIVRKEEGLPNDPDRKDGVMKGKHRTCYRILLTGLWPPFVLSGNLQKQNQILDAIFVNVEM